MRRLFLPFVSILCTAVLLNLGVLPASAGPGGGTYFANSPSGGTTGTALRKFVDTLPGIGAANANNLGQYIPVATPVTGKPGVPADGDYYEIGLVDYAEKLHSDLPKKTRLRGYVDLNPAFGAISSAKNRAHYLGPLIIAKRDRPVRVKFTNLLPTGPAGNLFLPVDESIMGAGMGPKNADGTPCNPEAPGAACAKYTQNRATIHLHGGNSPWISDGTTHQWITPAGEVTPYKRGASVRDVPDMWFDGLGNSVATGTPGATTYPGDGSMTFYWTNQQSGRLMFYHDHSYGITRLNVYAGEAAGYLLVDQIEDDLIDGTNLSGGNPGLKKVLPNLGGVYRYGIPLIIQDKSFVPQNIDVQDAGWNFGLSSTGGPKYTQSAAPRNKTLQPWGSYGDLWFPHVYEANQDPSSPDGSNPFGRWDYGPWFWPPISVAVDKGLIPDPSTTPESFADTPIVNGTAYPTLTVAPQPYRFRILNACNDRFLNLQLYYSDPADPSGKEIKMVPAAANPAYPAGPFPTVANWPTDGRAGGVPDPALSGPNIIQIGSEGGLLPEPVIHPNQPINYDYNRRSITVLNVLEKNLFLGPAERGDVVIDFSQVPPGSTLILYNDSPAPVPAGDPRLDYYTGSPDQTATGGAPSTLRGYGPNTRTIMQFKVAGAPAAAFNLTDLQNTLPAAYKAARDSSGSQAAIVPQPSYPAASGGNSPSENYSRIQDYAMTFTPVVTPTTPVPLLTTAPLQPKAIQELWDPFGRMNATLGVELPFTTGRNQTTIPMGYAEPTTETVIDGQPQLWKITHNGVDTHPVHFHMVDVQVVNRVGWDGAIKPPDPNELGWKETVRMNPLEDIIVALLPKKQTVPFTLPTSTRPLDPRLPSTALINTTDFGNLGISPTATPVNGVAVAVPNVPVANPLGYDYGYEYVWHCHILGHEENDFMRPFVFRTSTTLPPAPTGLAAYIGGQTVPGKTNYVVPYVNTKPNQIVLQWSDNAPSAEPSSFRVERSADNGLTFIPLINISFLPGYPPIFTDTNVASGASYIYRVFSHNALGDTTTPATTLAVTTGSWSAATGLTVVPSKPSPHVLGTNVSFTATGSGATTTVTGTAVQYYYRFWLQTGVAAPVLVQDYGTKNFWTLPADTPIGSYTVITDVRTSTAPTNAAGGYDFRLSLPYQIIATPLPPTTTYDKVPGIYSTGPQSITLTAANSAAVPVGSAAPTIYYTTDGTIPTTNTLTTFAGTGTITITATTTINFFAVDANRNQEAVQTGTWIIHPTVPPGDMFATASVVSSTPGVSTAGYTNTASVLLTASATDPAGIASMRFSNADAAGVCPANTSAAWSVEEPYAALTNKPWTLDAATNGLKTVCIQFRDKSLPFSWTPPGAPTGGVLYPPVTASITFDNTPPVVAPTPIPGTYPTTSVTLTANETATIYYTTDGTTPTTTSTKYTIPILLAATTTLKYVAVDLAGNASAVQTGLYTIQIPNLTASIAIANSTPNLGKTGFTNNANVTLTLSALTANTGSRITGMQFSNDGTTWSAVENYAPTKAWSLTAGDGLKTVYVTFTETTNLNTQIVYPPISATITLDTVPPSSTASPLTGIYSSPQAVTLAASETATIYYTTDGLTTPVPAATPTAPTQVYTAPIALSATTTLKYLAVDQAGNIEAVKTGTWTIQQPNLAASMTFNNNAIYTNQTAVTINISATSSTGVTKMQFSNDGVNFTAEEPFAATKAWALVPGDGLKTVYAKFRDGSAGGGFLSNPFTAQITLDTAAPVTTASPAPGTYAVAPVPVSLTSTEPGKIYYTTNGTTPSTASTVYTGPIIVSATTTIKYFAADLAGNTEPVKSGVWTISAGNLTASLAINKGAPATNSTAVVLTLAASDPNYTIDQMQLSNDGINYGAAEPFSTPASKNWLLPSGDGVKTVYVKFISSTAKPAALTYNPVSAQITLDTVAPVTTATPATGTYASTAPVSVSLTSSEPATIYYTVDGTVPTTASPQYLSPITLVATTTVNYYAIDAAGNAETMKTGTWTIHATPDLVASVKINNGAKATGNSAVTLTLSAFDPVGIATMQFSNDGISYTVEEPYTVSKAWTLLPGDGNKTVYVRFRDKSLGGGNLYAPVTAQITLDTVAPVTTAGPIPGIYASAPVPISLTSNEPATIYYTTDGTQPSSMSTVYTAPIAIPAGLVTTVKYFAVDSAGNSESVKSGTWTFHTPDLTATVQINNGAAVTKDSNVMLTLLAVDKVTGAPATMQFSNDGIAYSAEEPYATTKAWTLTAGDGLKNVYIRFREVAAGGGLLYDPITAQITLDTTAPITAASPQPGVFSTVPLPVTLTTNEPATIYYTTDGSTPTTLSAVYRSPLSLSATTTVTYRAVDPAGNVEPPKTGTWTLHTPDMVASLKINNGAAVTNSTTATLAFSASDPQSGGIKSMQFSNDGLNYTTEEPYAAATARPWNLTAGDGIKTVYVRFRDNTNFLYDPVTAQITLDQTPPVTTPGPVPGTYSTSPVMVTLSANEAATIYYTTDGSIPTAASTVYLSPITVSATTTIRYFAVDTAGNQETAKTGTWNIHASDLVASVKINGGAASTSTTSVALELSATDPIGVATMQFSNDGVTYSAEEPYAVSKKWNLTNGDGRKTVYVRFRDKSLPTGNLYDPVTAQITLDTVAPVTTASPVPGSYFSQDAQGARIPLSITLAANKPASIYYTTNGTQPTTGSTLYTGPISITADTTVRYFAADAAGNSEPVQTGTWTFHAGTDLVASAVINNGTAITNSSDVTLALSASDPGSAQACPQTNGVKEMQFSNDGISYSQAEPYATSKSWVLSLEEGLKTVYVKFRDCSGQLYPPVTATITFGRKDGLLPGTANYLASALKAMNISIGLVAPSALDRAHADVAPYRNGVSKPDGKIDSLDAFVILMRQVGLISSF